MTIVEQPDTIFDDHAGITAISLNTQAYNDSPSKYVRLIMRNCAMPAPPHTMTTFAALHDPQRPAHAACTPREADVRDRVRSSWLPYENQCNALASDIPLPAHAGARHWTIDSQWKPRSRRYEGTRIPLWLCACSSLSDPRARCLPATKGTKERRCHLSAEADDWHHRCRTRKGRWDRWRALLARCSSLVRNGPIFNKIYIPNQTWCLPNENRPGPTRPDGS